MIEIFKAAILGVVQGITEFLPVSSTGHLIILENYLGISQKTFGLSFDASLHLGTFLAVFIFFFRDWLKIIPAWFSTLKKRKIENFEERLSWMIVLGTIPAAILGFLFDNMIETSFRSTVLVAWFLILGSVIFIAAEVLGKKKIKLERFGYLGGFIVGLGQAVALIPGVSRSGITISFGMLGNLKREEAARFAFLLSAPIILGAGGKKSLEVAVSFLKGGIPFSEIQFFLIGIVTAAIFGFLTIKYFLRFLSKGNLYPFIIYRLVLGGLILILGF